MFPQLVQPFVLSFAIIFLSWLLIRFMSKGRYSKHARSREILLVVFLVYIAWLICITLYPPNVTSTAPVYRRVNLVPVVNSIQQYRSAFYGNIGYLKGLYLQNLIGNILLFIPFGFLLPLISGIKTFKRVLFFALLFSIAIEMLQFLAQFFASFRSVDIDDVILNVISAALGFLLYKLLRQFVPERELSNG